MRATDNPAHYHPEVCASSITVNVREHVRYAMSKLVAHFFMDQAAVAAVVRQRGVELLAETMEPPQRHTMYGAFAEEGSDDDGNCAISQVSTLCSAV
ncbi:unnamed protein product, partial [Sphacelaria rigidula]